MNDLFGLILLIALHLVLIATTFGLLFQLAGLVRSAPTTKGRIQTYFAIAAALLLYIGARRAGINLPEMIHSAILNIQPVRFAALHILFPSTLGFFVASFLFRGSTNSHSGPLLALLTTITIAAFTDLYTFGIQGSTTAQHDANIIPNISFSAALLLRVALRSSVGRVGDRTSWRTLVNKNRQKSSRG